MKPIRVYGEEPNGDDVTRVQNALASAGFYATREQCVGLWRAHSAGWDAGWLGLPESDAEVVEVLRGHFEPLDADTPAVCIADGDLEIHAGGRREKLVLARDRRHGVEGWRGLVYVESGDAWDWDSHYLFFSSVGEAVAAYERSDYAAARARF